MYSQARVQYDALNTVFTRVYFRLPAVILSFWSLYVCVFCSTALLPFSLKVTVLKRGSVQILFIKTAKYAEFEIVALAVW